MNKLSSLLPGILHLYLFDDSFRSEFNDIIARFKHIPLVFDDGTEFRSLINDLTTSEFQEKREEAARKLYALASKEKSLEIPTRGNSFESMFIDAVINNEVRNASVELNTNPEKHVEIFEKINSLKNLKLKVLNNTTNDFDENFEGLIKKIDDDKVLAAIPSWPKLSTMIGGFNPGRVTMILANTGYGKTNLILNLAFEASKIDPVVFVNMEMTYKDIFERLIVSISDVTWNDIRNKIKPDKTKVFNKIKEIKKLYITSGKDMYLHEIKTFIREKKEIEKIWIVFIDYDQKLKLDVNYKTPEWKALQDAFVDLEALSKELNIHIVVASQAGQEEGKVSGSHRSKFPCSSVLYFHEHEEYGPILEPKKNRFGGYDKYLKINYIKNKTLTTEGDLVDGRREEKRRYIRRENKKDVYETRDGLRKTPPWLAYDGTENE